MNRKQLILIFLALVLLGGASLFLLKHNEQSWSVSEGKMGQKLFPTFPVNDIAAVSIQGRGTVHLERKGGTWQVQERNGYPADFNKIKDLLIAISGLKVTQSEPIGPSQLTHMELQPPGKGEGSGILVTFADDKGKTLQSVLVGKKHLQHAGGASAFDGGDYPNGRYVMLADNQKELLTISDPLSNIETNAGVWLKQDFFKVEKPASITVISTDETNSWKITRTNETTPWVLADVKAGEIMDSNKVSSLSSAFSFASFVDVATNTAAAQSGLDKPYAVQISTFDHMAYEIKIGSKTPEDNYYLTVAVTGDLPTTRPPTADEKPEDKAKLDKEFETQNKTLQDKLTQEKALGQWIYLVGATQLDPIMRQRGQLMVDEKSTSSETDTNKPGLPGELPTSLLPSEIQK
jgi:Domain of unknown function (DUF4340)